jgi:putative ABC transport system permease protein
MNVLYRKLVRDIRHMAGQVLATSLVVACGVASFVAMRSTYTSLKLSQETYYARYRFADVFAGLKRAPESIRPQIESIPGVSAVQTRVIAEVAMDLPDLAEPAQATLVSIPPQQTDGLNDLHLVQGRYIDPARSAEVIISGAFAEANAFVPGDQIEANINGRKRKLTIVGIALSPEYIYEIRPGDIFPDNRRYGIVWMNRRDLASAYQMDGAFNTVSLTLAPGAHEEDVIQMLDTTLAPYGGLGAYGRVDQQSYRFIANEFSQLRTFGLFLPIVFLAVTAFLLHLVLSRLVKTEREQIGLLKAFGYSNARIARHYLLFAMCCIAPGAAAGIAIGVWLGSAMTNLYTDYFHFPVLEFAVSWTVVALSFLLSFVSAAAGAISSLIAVVTMPPAEAMRPEAPTTYRPGVLERFGIQSLVAPANRIVIRNLARQPIKAMLAMTGISLAAALLFTGFYFFDAIDRIVEIQFQKAIREDVIVSFHTPRPGRVRNELMDLPGVTNAEFFRAVPVRLRNEHLKKRIALQGVETGASLHRIVDKDGVIHSPPTSGVLVSDQLAKQLDINVGDKLIVEVLEGSRPVRNVTVVQTIDEMLGTIAYMEINSLNRMIDEDDAVSGAYLSVSRDKLDALYSQLKNMPSVEGVGLPGVILKGFQDTFARTIGGFTFFLVAFSGAIVFGVVYNAARVALSERGRELASLRVLGFTKGEISHVLFGEQAILTVAAMPFGCLIGVVLCYAMNNLVDRDLLRLPLVFSAKTVILTALIVTAASIVSGLIVSRRLRHLDLIEVLKTRE